MYNNCKYVFQYQTILVYIYIFYSYCLMLIGMAFLTVHYRQWLSFFELNFLLTVSTSEENDWVLLSQLTLAGR